MSAPDKHPVLIVDDEPDILLSLRGSLRREFELHTAETGEEALAILAETPIHVVMTDQRMPGMSGTELMERVRKEYPDTIRILFTGYSDIKAVVEMVNTSGLFRYLTKPWDPDEMLDVLQQAAAKYDEHRERRKLLTDVQTFLDGECQLFADVETALADRDSFPERIREHRSTGAALGERVKRLIHSQSNGGGDSP